MNETKATRYQRLRRRAQAVSQLTGCVVLAVVALTSLAHQLAGWAAWLGGGTPAPRLVATAGFVLVLVALLEIAALPGLLYFEYRSVHRYRRVRTPLGELLAAQGQASLVALSAALVGAGVWGLSVSLAGPWWWAMASVLIASLLVAALRGTPAVLSRLADVQPVTRPGLVRRLETLAQQARVSVAGLHEWRVDGGGGPTALVTGLGRTRRVFISSAILRDWSDDEVAVVIAHELGHHRHHDLWRTLVLDGAVLSLALWAADSLLRRTQVELGLGGADDLAALPLVTLVAGFVWVVATPVRLAASRRQERRADMFALAVTGGAEAFRAAVRRLGAEHLAEERPSVLTRWLFQRHPSVAERVALAEAYRPVSAPATMERRRRGSFFFRGRTGQ
jgi:STE24 endopeptidase